tara:strand:+ start:56832 stop:57035 length:204 start_codon:yes stop_codon:yes gene_type:complete
MKLPERIDRDYLFQFKFSDDNITAVAAGFEYPLPDVLLSIKTCDDFLLTKRDVIVLAKSMGVVGSDL